MILRVARFVNTIFYFFYAKWVFYGLQGFGAAARAL